MDTNLIDKILSETATNAEIEQFEDWLKQAEQNQRLYEKTKVIWERIDGVYAGSSFDQSAAKSKIRSKIQLRKRSTQSLSIRFRISVAASILLLIGLGFSVLYMYNQKSRNEIAYSSGEAVKEIQLADGSHIWLNVNSFVTVLGSFGKKQREVFLKGEAYFEVKRDESKPFKIHAGETVTEVLGTSFNVELDTVSGNVNVAVITGKVGFYQTDKKKEWKILFPNDVASYHQDNQSIVLSANSNPNFLSWKTGVLRFDDTPVDEVCRVLSRHYHKQIISKINQPDMVLTGTFHNESLDDTLKTLELSLDIKIKTHKPKIVIKK